MRRLLIIFALLSMSAMAQVSFVNKCTGTTSCASVPAHQAGDLFIAYAGVNASATNITLPAGWTSSTSAPTMVASINGTSTADSAARIYCKIATSSSETVTGFTTATSLEVQIYRGTAQGACNTVALGTISFFTSTVNTTSVTETFNTVTNAKSTSWDFGAGYAPAATAGIATAPAGMTNRASVGNVMGGHDTNAAVASFSTANVTLTTAGRIITVVAEILAPTADAPTITSASGSFTVNNNDTSFTIANGGSAVSSPGFCYTTDGSTPNSTNGTTCSAGTLYSGAVNVTATATVVKAIAIKAGANDSGVTTQTFTLTTATPVASPATESFVGSASVGLTSTTTSLTSLRYTTDGSAPSCPSTGTAYSTPISVSATTTIKSVACKTNYATGAAQSDVYTLTVPATYYVKKTGSDANTCTQAKVASTPKLTIGSATACLSAGDTLVVFAGTYAEDVTIPAGSSGSNVTFTVNADDVVYAQSLTLNSYNTVTGGTTLRPTTTGLHIQNPASPNTKLCVTVTNGATQVHVTNSNFYACGSAYMVALDTGGSAGAASHISFQNNTFSYSSAVQDLTYASNVGSGILVRGDNWLIEGNNFSHMVLTINWRSGNYLVVRNNTQQDTYGTNPNGTLTTIDCVPNLSSTAVTVSGSTVTAASGTPFNVFFIGTWINLTSGGTTKYVIQSVGGSGASVVVSPAPTAGSTNASTPSIGGNCHADFFFSEPPSTDITKHTLVEGNTIKNSFGADNKTFLFQGQDGCGANGNCHHFIVDANTVVHQGGLIFSQFDWPNGKAFNNTFVDIVNYTTFPDVVLNGHDSASTNNTDVNEIFVLRNSHTSVTPVSLPTTATGSTWGYSDAVFLGGASGTLYSHIYDTGTWLGDTGNKTADPLFVGYSASDVGDLHLDSSSPALNAGTSLTTANGAGVASTSLTVHDAYPFQDGWGMTTDGVQPNVICVGTVSNCAQISAGSINYATGGMTLASALTWSDAAPVYMKKTSYGTDVLTGTAPNMGALGVSSVKTLSASPTSFAFGNQSATTTSAPQCTTVSSTGGLTVNISSIALLTGTAYAISSNSCGSTLATGNSCSVCTTFTPPTGITYNDTLQIASDATVNPTDVTMSGAGVGPPSTTAALDVNGRTQVSVCRGQAATLNWSVVGDTNLACSIDNGVGSLVITDPNLTTGSNSVSPTATTTYTLSCTSTTGTASANVTVNAHRCGGPF